MTQPVIAPIMSNLGALEEAIGASSSAIFTATDRKIINERVGEVDRQRRFKEILEEKGLTREVENEETSVREGREIPELESRLKAHAKMLKHSPLIVPREKAEISENINRQVVISPNIQVGKPEAPLASNETAQININHETAAMIRELNLDPVELAGKFSLTEEEMLKLVHKIKTLHLKRLLANSKGEFESLSQRIKKETIAFAKKEARAWLEAKLDELTLKTAQYKINLLKSMQALEFNPEREKEIHSLSSVKMP